MRLLIIGEIKGYIATAGRIAMDRGAKVIYAHTIEEGFSVLRAGRGGDLVMINITFDIKAFLTQLRAECIHVPVVACGVGGSSEKAANAIRAGVQEYIPLPPDPELIAAIIEAVAKVEENMLCKDPKMMHVVKVAERIAPSEANVLIIGESGTGKEIMARFIHNHSRRKKEPFVSVNCAAIPENLLESELFGHEKGAFTGAISRKLGKFEASDQGTLLLDEISEMAPHLQAKILRVVQEREIDRVGGIHPVKINIRILATTNRNLLKEVELGNFREDLFYRLNVVSLALPPLRERIADIDVLCAYFLEKFSKMNYLPKKSLSKNALQAIKQHPWRGNIRELENVIHRAILFSKGPEIDRDVLFDSPTQQVLSDTSFVGQTVSSVERKLIVNTIEHCFGNRTHAANILGISIRTLRNKLKQYAQETERMPHINKKVVKF